jgi:hypothetical protein|tara:strand:- start:1014 stop:2099 length:1086 start_codon:yes stop_codon:yes gene_type:complete
MTITVRKGFGPQKQDIDLTKYEGRWSDKEIQSHSKRGKFIQFAFLDLKKFGGDIVCEELNNMAIRKDGNRDNVDKDIAYSYEMKGWSYDPFPPIVDTSFNTKDGRTRIRAAILSGCTFIPVAVFSYPDSDPSVAYVQNLSEALIGNDDLISRPTKEGDLFEAAVAAITNGGIKHDKTAISYLLLKEFEALRFIKQDQVSDLVDNIFDAVKGGQRAVWNPSRDDVLAYLNKSPDLPEDAYFNGDCVNGKKVHVYSSGETNRGRLWTKISKNVPEDCYVVLYTTDKIPSRIKSRYEDFMSFIEMRYKECFEIVNRTASAAGINIKIEPPGKRPWKLLGVIPQLNNTTHETLRKAHRLIQVEDC